MEIPVTTIMCATPRGDMPAPKGKPADTPKDALGGDGTEDIPPGLRRTKDRLPVPPPKGQKPAVPKMPPKAKDKPAAQAKPAAKTGSHFGKEVRAGSKAEMVGLLLLREEGCTKSEVLAATGWPSVSMPAQARAVGLTLVKEKDKGKPTRYWGELPA